MKERQHRFNVVEGVLKQQDMCALLVSIIVPQKLIKAPQT